VRDKTVRELLLLVLSCGIFLVVTPALSGQEIPEKLDLKTALKLGLENHPALAAAAAAVSGTEGLVRQSSTRPNPSFVAQSENWRFYGDPSFQMGSDLDLFLYVNQPIERGNRRARRIELSSQERLIAELRQKDLEWKVRQEIKRMYWLALLAQRERELIKQNVTFFGQVTDYHEARVREGAMAEVDLIRVQLEEDKLRLQEESAEVESQRALADLVKTMGLHAPRTWFTLEDRLEDLPESGATLAELVRLALDNRTDIRLVEAELERAKREVDLEVARGKQDWNVMLGYKRTEGFHTVLAGLNIPLPIFDQNVGNIYFRQFEVDRREALLREKQAQIQVEIRGAADVLSKRLVMLEQVEPGMVQRAEESWNIAEAAYREGATDLLRLLDAQRSRSEVRLLRNRVHLDLQIGIVDLEEAVGTDHPPIGLETFRAQN